MREWWRGRAYPAIGLLFLAILTVLAFGSSFEPQPRIHPDAIAPSVAQTTGATINDINGDEVHLVLDGLLVLFTGTLWWSTKGLWEETKKGGETSAKLADVAEKQLLIQGLQTDIQKKQHEVGRRQFLSQSRPRIIVRLIAGPFQETDRVGVPRPFVRVTVVNTGYNDATVTHFGGSLLHKEVGPGTSFGGAAALDATKAELIEPITLVTGQRHTFETLAPVGFTWQVFMRLHELSSSAVYAIGNVTYTDPAGTERHTAYWRQYAFDAERFTASERDDEEYQD